MKQNLESMLGDSADSISNGSGARRMGLAASCSVVSYLNLNFIRFAVGRHLISEQGLDISSVLLKILLTQA